MLLYKYRRAVAVLLTCILLFAGCAADSGSLLDYQNSVKSATVSWCIEDREYTADIVFESDVNAQTEYRQCSVNVISPDEISGVSLCYSEDGVVARTGEVSLELPDNTGREVYRIIRSMSLHPEEAVGAGNGSGEVTAVRYEVPLYDGITEYDITYNEEKYPSSAVIKWDGGEMTVKYEGFVNGTAETSASDVN